MTCYSKKGIEDIKEALKQGLIEEDNLKLDITLVAAPKYLIICDCVQTSKGKKLIQKGLDLIKACILKKEGSFEIKEISNT